MTGSRPTIWPHEHRCLRYEPVTGERCGGRRAPDSNYCQRHRFQRAMDRATAENQAAYSRRIFEEAARRRSEKGVGLLIPPAPAPVIREAPPARARQLGPGDPEWDEMHHMYFGDVDDDGGIAEPDL